MNYIFAQQRLLRAIIYGSGTAPLAHVHFNFLEWLVVKKVGNRLDLLQVDLVLIPTIVSTNYVPTDKKSCEATEQATKSRGSHDITGEFFHR